jgi:chemotaxis protein histidine kinase CheA
VDQLLGKRMLLIKNLGVAFRQQDLLGGTAILGAGRVGLIMDVDALVKCQKNNNRAKC